MHHPAQAHKRYAWSLTQRPSQPVCQCGSSLALPRSSALMPHTGLCVPPPEALGKCLGSSPSPVPGAPKKGIDCRLHQPFQGGGQLGGHPGTCRSGHVSGARAPHLHGACVPAACTMALLARSVGCRRPAQASSGGRCNQAAVSFLPRERNWRAGMGLREPVCACVCLCLRVRVHACLGLAPPGLRGFKGRGKLVLSILASDFTSSSSENSYISGGLTCVRS